MKVAAPITQEAMVMDKKLLIDLITKELHKCNDPMLLDLIHKLLLKA